MTHEALDAATSTASKAIDSSTQTQAGVRTSANPQPRAPVVVVHGLWMRGGAMKVLRRMEGWRLVEDPDGARGWMLARFLKRDRGAIVKGKGLAEMREKGDDGARLLWRLEPGVSGRLGDCDGGWCRLDLGDGRAGFVAQERLWGWGNP